jgi:hypothetical protein
MQMKQTSIDFLEEFLKQYDCAHSSLDYYELKIPMHIFDKKIGQAKEMERQQIVDANRDGVDMVVDKKDFISGEQYYNETYNKQ